jgi:hypothetical protein
MGVAISLLAAALPWTTGCGPGVRAQTAPPPDLAAKAAAAALETQRGCYVGFKNAAGLYEELYRQPAMKDRVAFPFVRTLLLLLIREREIGILSHDIYPRAIAVIEHPFPRWHVMA